MISPLKFEHFLLSSILMLLTANMTIAMENKFLNMFDNSKLINENATILHPLTNGSAQLDMNDPTFLATLPWHCQCSKGKKTLTVILVFP
jgi:hypothetical protein